MFHAAMDDMQQLLTEAEREKAKWQPVGDVLLEALQTEIDKVKVGEGNASRHFLCLPSLCFIVFLSVVTHSIPSLFPCFTFVIFISVSCALFPIFPFSSASISPSSSFFLHLFSCCPFPIFFSLSCFLLFSLSFLSLFFPETLCFIYGISHKFVK